MVDTCSILCIIEIIILIHILYLIYYPYIAPVFKESFHIKPGCDDPKILELQEKLKPMFAENVVYTGPLANENKKKIINDLTLCPGKKSYTINKEDIYLCLKDENNKYYNDNMLIYVLLHEISHQSCYEIGHTPLFHEIFQLYLAKAIELGIYNPNIPIIKNYCTYND